MTILDKILREKRLEVEVLLAEEKVAVTSEKTRPSLFQRLYKAEKLQVIAEMKRASPSKGLIAEGARSSCPSKILQRSGCRRYFSVDGLPFFQRIVRDLEAVAKAVSTPILCKDFMIHKVQIDKAKNAGASVILLIVSALEPEELAELYTYATGLGLEVLVEVHDAEELKQALAIDAKLIGVNNRDLKTFEVDLARTEEIAAHFPFDEERVLISESGLVGQDDAIRVAEAGANGVLVGESLMRSGSVTEAINALQVPLKRAVR